MCWVFLDAICWVFWDATIFCNKFMLPKQPSATRPHFGQTCLFTNFPNILTTIRGSEFRGIREKAGLSKMGVSCRRLFPNEDFGWPNERLGTHFRSTFQRGEYSIWATFLWKVLRKCVPKRSFGLPKSLFGEHKVCKMITKDSSNMWCDAMCWFFWDATNSLLSFVTTLQDDYKR